MSDKIIMTKEEVLNEILDGGLSNILEMKSERQGEVIYLPEIKMTIRPVVHDARDNYVNLYFLVESEIWKTDMFECSVGMGSDTKNALGMALASFAFSFMNGIKNYMDDFVKASLTTTFANKEHKWKVYASNIVGTGKKAGTEPSDFWGLLEDDIIKRLGNQRVAYVKIYAAKDGINKENNYVTGECRINDIAIPDLGEKVYKLAKEWETDDFVSEKQFFFIVQDEETLLPNPYEGKEGRNQVVKAVETYLKLFSKVEDQESYNQLFSNVLKEVPDKTLVSEFSNFITEICAERVFEENMLFGDKILVARPDGKMTEVYKTQFADYLMIKDAVFLVLQSGVLGEKTNDVFSQLVAISCIADTVQQARENGSPDKNLRLKYTIINVDQDFEIR